MGEKLTVLIDGVRYVPAREVSAGVDDFRNALLDVFWGEGYRGSNPERAGDNLFVTVFDDATQGGTPFNAFMDDLIANLTALKDRKDG